MAKQLNVNLNFTADVSAAKKNIETLKQSLNAIGATNIGKGTNEGLQKAVTSAKELQTHLTKAFNTKTGNLDLTKFQMSLQRSNLSLSQLSTNLLGAGKNGETAFLSMHKALASANLSLNKTQGLLGQLGTTFLNTLRWQATSTAIHEIAGAINSAVRYAEDLNNSLNSIRIVTGQSTDQMAEFANYCNESAQALNTSTLAMSKAALIYFQQGLSTDEVKERTETTIKMANVTGEAAQQVSSYMTAIWNNFDDGSESLEHFGDVLAALGATTASSSKEIAEGLQQFASIGQTVGLSYDYATSALATIVANTRESANTVGTSLKTIFSRIQGLSLGETAEDGVNLNKYSEALSKIGVEVLDQQGNLKDLDIILDDLASKWDGLTRAQQTATAQTVAGTRQYTRLMALMNNWDDMEKNLGTAENADGTLQEQQEIFAESWEGSLKRIKAAWEEIYGDLIDDEFVIKLMNGFADLINIIEKFVKGLGGMKTIILMISTLLMNKFQANIASALDTSIYKFGQFRKSVVLGAEEAEKVWSKNGMFKSFSKGIDAARKEMEKFQNSALLESKKSIFDVSNMKVNNPAFNTRIMELQNDYKLQERVAQLQNKMTAEEQRKIEFLQQQKTLTDDMVMEEQEKLQIQEKELLILQESLQNKNLYGFKPTEDDKLSKKHSFSTSDKGYLESKIKEFELSEEIKLEEKEILITEKGIAQVRELSTNILGNSGEAEKIILSAKEQQFQSEKELITFLEEQCNLRKIGFDDLLATVGIERKEIKSAEQLEKSLKENVDLMSKFAEMAGISAKEVNELKIASQKTSNTRGNFLSGQSTSRMFEDNINKGLDEANIRSEGIAAKMSKAAGSAMQLGMSISMVSSALKTLNDDEASLGDKLTSALMSIGFSLPLIEKGISGVVSSFALVSEKSLKNNMTESEKIALLQSEFNTRERLLIEETRELYLNGEISKEEAKQRLLTQQKGQFLKNLKKEQLEGLLLETEENVVVGYGNILTTLRYIIEKKISKEKAKQLLSETLKNNKLLKFIKDHWKLLAVTALITAAAITLYKVYNRQNKALKEAKKHMSDMKKAANEAQNAWNELSDAFDKIEDSKKTIKDLTKGTVEWKEAIADVNQEVLQLLDKYPELVQYIEKDANGMLSISDEGRNAILTKQYNRVNMTQFAYANSQQAVREAENEKLIVDFSRQNDYFGKVTNLGDQDFIKEAFNAYQEMGEEFINSEYINSIIANSFPEEKIDEAKVALLQLCEQLAVNNEAMGLLNTNMADSMLSSGMQGYEQSDYQSELQKYMANRAEEGNNTKWNVNGKQAREFYAQNVLGEDFSKKSGLILGENEYRLAIGGIKYKDENGNKQKVKFKDLRGEYADYLNFSQAGDLTASFGNNLITQEDIIKKQLQKSSLDLKDFEIEGLAQNLLKGAVNEDTSVFDEINENQLKALKEAQDSGTLKNTVESWWNTGTFAEAAQDAGYESAQEYLDYLEEGIKNYDPKEAAEKLQDKLTQGYKDLADQYEIDEDAVRGFSEQLVENNKDLEGNVEGTLEATNALIKFEKNYKNLVSAFTDNKEVLDMFNAGEVGADSLEVQEAFAAIGQAWEDMTGIHVSNDFVEKHLKELGELADGDMSVIDKLQAAAAKDYIISLNIDESGKKALQGLSDELSALEDKTTIDFSTNVDTKDYVDKLNEMLQSGDITQEQVNQALTNIGWSGNFEQDGWEEDPITTKQSLKWTSDMFGERDIGVIETATYSPKMKLKSADKNAAGGVTSAMAKGFNPSTTKSSKSAGSSGSNKNKKDKTKKEDVSERYHAINKSLDRNEKALNRIQKAEEKTWGAAKLKLYDRELKKINKTLDLTQKKVKEAQKYQKTDLSDLKKTGIKIKDSYLNGDGSLTSKGYDAITNQMLAEMNAAEDAYNGYVTSHKGEQQTDKMKAKEQDLADAYDEAKKKFDEQKEALSKYEESVEQVKEAIQSWMDTYDEMLAKSYEKLEYQMEIKATLNENSLKQIDYYINKYSDGIYKNIEALGGLNYNLIKGGQGALENTGDSYYYQQLLKGIRQARQYGNDDLANSTTKIKWTDINGKEKTSKSYLSALEAMNKNGVITQADYVKGLQAGYDNTLESLNSLIGYMQNMNDYWQLGIDEYKNFFDQLNENFEHSSSILDHFKNILELTGNKSSEVMANIYSTRTDTAFKQYEASKKQYESLKTAFDKLEQRTREGQENATKVIEGIDKDGKVSAEEQAAADKIIADSVSSLHDLEEQMYSDFESYVQALTDETTYYIENQMDALEDALTEMVGGFEEILNRMNMSSTYSSEYLTETNKLYETNKLLRTLQKDMNNSDNKAAKQKYAAYMSELKQLQSKDKLSNLELDIAQKKYDLLKAQIALEDSQNAKQTVRLMRDNEGNYGYVYTMSEEVVTEAEQAVEDAENALYNAELEAANNYGQKIIQTEKEAQEKMSELYQNYINGTYGAYGSAEALAAYNEAKDNAIETYGELLGSYTDLYAIATTDDARVVNDAWITAYDDIIEKSYNWKDLMIATSNSVSTVMLKNTQLISDAMEDIVNQGLVDEIGKNNQSIAEAVVEALDGGGEMQALLDAINDTTAGYITQKDALDKMVTTLEEVVEYYNLLMAKESANSSSRASFNKLMTYTNDFFFEGMGKGNGLGSENGYSYIKLDDDTNKTFKSVLGGMSEQISSLNEFTTDTILGYIADNRHGYWGLLQNGQVVYQLDSKSNEQPSKSKTEEWRKKKEAVWATSFDTGGYTGRWGADGRLAMLHQKELVLNADDTENMLSAIDIVRDIVKTINLNNLQNSLSVYNSNISVPTMGQTLEQSVSINAEFPNATNHTEIEQAFENLKNKALQYASRNR